MAQASFGQHPGVTRPHGHQSDRGHDSERGDYQERPRGTKPSSQKPVKYGSPAHSYSMPGESISTRLNGREWETMLTSVSALPNGSVIAARITVNVACEPERD